MKAHLPMKALVPNVALLCKLGSIVVHVDEYLSDSGHPLDLEVREWLEQMQELALIPVRRS